MAYGLADIVTIGRDGVRVVAGWTEPVTLAPVGAGVGTSGRTIPGETYERVLAAHATLIASAVAGARAPALEILDGAGHLVYQVRLSADVLASTEVFMNAAVNGSDNPQAEGVSSVMIPDLLLPPGYTVRFDVSAIDAADQLGGMSLLLQRYPSNLVSVLQESLG